MLQKEPAPNSAHFEHQLKQPPPAEQLRLEHTQRLQHWRSLKRHSREWGEKPLMLSKTTTTASAHLLQWLPCCSCQ